MDTLLNMFVKLSSTKTSNYKCSNCGYFKRIKMSSCNKYCPICSNSFNNSNNDYMLTKLCEYLNLFVIYQCNTTLTGYIYIAIQKLK